jgi:PAS domain S-box-containing protein
MHKLLQKQLNTLGIDAELGPESQENWERLLDKISNAYADHDQHRYLTNRALEISSREMRARWHTLKLLEEQWRSLGECSPDLIMMVDIYGTITFANRSKDDFSKEKLVGKNLFSLYPLEYGHCLEKLFKSLQRERTIGSVEIQEQSENGDRWYTLRVSPILKSEEIVGVVVVETDVTQVRKFAIETWIEALNSYVQTAL